MTPTKRDRPARRSLTGGAAPVVLAVLAVALAGCSGASDQAVGTSSSHGAHDDTGTGEATRPPHEGAGHGAAEGAGGDDAAPVALRDGERRLNVAMPEPYRPVAPTANGMDDYRCFLLDPGLAEDTFVTGTDVSPGERSLVHHVILFQVPPEQVAAARVADSSTPGQGWTCFGGSGLGGGGGSQATPWLGAWTPGAGESVLRDGYGVPLAAGSQLIMQVHYSLLSGAGADVTATDLRVMDGSADLAPVATQLLPAPVELPCRPEHADGPLCDRAAALDDVRQRFGQGAGGMAEWLRGRCPGTEPGPVQSCTTTFSEPGTIIGVAGHMHLLGRAIRVELNPGTPGARTILDVPVWNFDDQGAVPIGPVEVLPGDEVRVTCEHDQELRDHLPAFEGQAERYVLWGEGTADEMCAGILQIAP